MFKQYDALSYIDIYYENYNSTDIQGIIDDLGENLNISLILSRVMNVVNERISSCNKPVYILLLLLLIIQKSLTKTNNYCII